VSWPLGAYGMLALALAAGFVWYERTKPDARVVALVGTLAALAALGRIAFAPLPNVKPTTDIVLAAGYALGGAPGFVVGAVAALTSNFFFGQGPWTPWQMAGWGLTGLLGAGLAQLTRGRIGRWPLALVCFLAGFAFTVLGDVGDWVTFSDHSLGALGLYVGQGLGFDLVHAAGCLAFALAFGPALIRSLRRFRLRLQVTWLAPALVVAALGLHAAAPAPAAARGGATPLQYLLSAQNLDGGYGSAPRQASASLFSGWAALGLAAAGADPAHVSRGGPTLLTYLERHPGSDPGSLERSILAIRSGGGPAAGLAARLQRDVRGDGSVARQTNLTAFAILALRAAGRAVSPRTLAWLERQQDRDGGFNFATAPGSSDVDDTGAVLEALAGRAPAARLRRAVAFVVRQQDHDGGFPSQPGGDANAQSTAFAVQGLIAAGGSTGAVARGQRYLRGLIASDGHVAYARGDSETPVWVTAQAALALFGRPLPLAAPAVVVGPVARRPPARNRRSHAPPNRAVRHTSRRSVSRAPRPRRRMAGVRLAGLARGVGILAAVVLAPVENP
jgi:energy-coupling factor transport system substrate-specific component